MHALTKRILDFKHSLPKGCQLTVVTKYFSMEDTVRAIASGCAIGESRVNDYEKKQPHLPQHKLIWVGHVQSNKVKKVCSYAAVIESVDSYALLDLIDEAAKKLEKKQEIYLQVNATSEPQKYGFTLEEIENAIEKAKNKKHIALSGLMAMGKKDDPKATTCAFRETKSIALRHALMASMGMSADYSIALKEGSNEVRIGGLFSC